MKRQLLALMVAFLITLAVKATQESNKPNIIFFLADDLGYRDLACYSHPYAKTPTLDQLAAEGTRFTQAYAAGPTCNPSRTGIMTGISVARFDKRTDDFGFGDSDRVDSRTNDVDGNI